MACNSNINNLFFDKDIIPSQNNQLLDGGLRANRFPSGVLKVVERKRGQVTCSLSGAYTQCKWS